MVRVARGRGANAVAAELRTEGVDTGVLTRTAFQMLIVDLEPGDLRIVDDHSDVAQFWEDKTVRVAKATMTGTTLRKIVTLTVRRPG